VSASGYALGIDLGTTYTAAAVWRDGRAETLPLGDRAHAVPSVLLLEDDGSVVAGEAAAGRAAAESARVTREFKRSFGDEIGVLVAGQQISAYDLTGRLLDHVLRWVIDAEGAPPQQVAVTVPATWRGYRTGLMETLLAGALAGIGPAGTLVLPEPAAAAVHYAGRRRLEPGTTVGVYDLGGGTFDATVLRKTGGSFEIAGLPVGADDLGGADLDHALMRRAGILLGPGFAALDRHDPQIRAGLVMLRDAVVVAKEALSSSASVTVPVVLPGLPPTFQLTREHVEAEAGPLLARTVEVFRTAVELTGLDLDALDAVLLVGGSSRIPLVARLVREQLGRPITVDAHPKYAVCLGAAISAGARLQAMLPGPLPAPSPPVPAAVPPEPAGQDGWVAEPRFGDELSPRPAGPDRTALVVDLRASGLTSADEVPLRPAAELRQRVRTDPVAAAMTIRLGQDAGYRAQSWSSAGRALATALGLLALAAIVVTVLNTLH
jgi:molecular chaperone DnaK